MKERKTAKKIVKILGIVLVALVIGILTYLGDYYHADQTAHDALISSDQVNVREEGNLTIFMPTAGQDETGFIFYPGGKVEDIAYAPLVRALAEQGYPAVIVGMPFNLAVFNINGADAVMETIPEIENWVMVGHSLGGAMASDYLAEHEDQVSGLVLLGAYPNESLTQSSHPVLSLYGSTDQIIDQQGLAKGRDKMPREASYYEIAGGNHSGFGNYGLQAGDGTASITQAEQQVITVEKIMEIWKGN
ncbi:alpha/beta fold hydrolase [Acetobacterium wieringae]|uniref:Alpha/beta fold hydrolase n=1 Tax=Acetobacterium wieringae TaxID=52694 RepID=A0A5D0WT02_9FIRM|nr:alpha/beta fold hydrolase [Acetobacterium wieringae]TYC87400.1 alpha/beta fold hydrolase [Acetobacterium wieringae]